MGSIVTRDELSLYLNQEGYEERIDPKLLDAAIGSAEAWVRTYTGRDFYPEPLLDTDPEVTKTFAVRSGDKKQNGAWVRIPDLRTASSVLLDSSTLTEYSDYEFGWSGDEPFTTIKLLNYSAFSNPYTYAEASLLTITGRWGWETAPGDVRDAVLALAARQYRRRDAMFADVVDRGTVAFEYTKGVPNFVRDFLSPYKIPRIAVV